MPIKKFVCAHVCGAFPVPVTLQSAPIIRQCLKTLA